MISQVKLTCFPFDCRYQAGVREFLVLLLEQPDQAFEDQSRVVMVEQALEARKELTLMEVEEAVLDTTLEDVEMVAIIPIFILYLTHLSSRLSHLPFTINLNKTVTGHCLAFQEPSNRTQ